MAVDAFGEKKGGVDAGMWRQRVMAAFATLCEDGERLPFLHMGLMTGVAVEGFGLAVALAAEEELVLIAVNVQGRGIIVADGLRVVIGRKRLTWAEPEQRALFGVDTGMTAGADIELLLPGERGQPGDKAGRFLVGMFRLPGGMLCGRAMATFAVDAIEQTAAIKLINLVKRVRRQRALIADIRGVTFKTFGRDRAAKPDTVRRKIGAVGPGLLGDKIRNGQFKDPVASPIQIRLRFTPRADDDVEAVRFLSAGEDGGLKEAAVEALQENFAVRTVTIFPVKKTFHRAAIGRIGGKGVRGMYIRGGNVAVTIETGGGAGEGFAAGVSGRWRGMDAAGEEADGCDENYDKE